ncbi:hypothetical protein [Janibacter melonis]|nr:hypothetical protein [Janibacter melonis]
MKRTVVAFALAVAALIGGVAAASAASADDASSAAPKIVRGFDWT